jgi:hypothetical protein
MLNENRQREYNPKIVADLAGNYDVHLNQAELSEGKVLEGTGSLVFDNKNKIIFLSQSSRGSLTALDMYMETFDKVQPGYRVVGFSSLDESGS